MSARAAVSASGSATRMPRGGRRSAVSTRKGGGYYGYKVHAAVCVVTGLPVAWTVETASAAEQHFALPLIDKARERGFKVNTAIMDKGYDKGPIHDGCTIHDGCMYRDVAPVVALMETARVKRGEHKPPCCEHGKWTFAGADYKRRATKWRCPTGACQPKSTWVKADRLHPLIPRETARSRRLYHSRGAVEREFGRLKHEWAMLPLRVRGLERVRLHADLTILAKLSCALARARPYQSLPNSTGSDASATLQAGDDTSSLRCDCWLPTRACLRPGGPA